MAVGGASFWIGDAQRAEIVETGLDGMLLAIGRAGRVAYAVGVGGLVVRHDDRVAREPNRRVNDLAIVDVSTSEVAFAASTTGEIVERTPSGWRLYAKPPDLVRPLALRATDDGVTIVRADGSIGRIS